MHQPNMDDDGEHRQSNNTLLFRLAISNSFKRIAESVSEDRFLDMLTILQSKPSTVKRLHTAMFQELYEAFTGDFEDMLSDESLQIGLEKVAKLTEADSSVIEDAWRPPGDAALHLRSLDAHKIKEESDLLEKQVKKMEEENAMLMKKVADERLRVTAIDEKITRCLNASSTITDKLGERLQGLEKCFMALDDQ